jgi:uncharacterized protein with von Willebrand factor type A (vWA) domain
MDGVKQQIHARHQEAVDARHQFEMRKNNRELKVELDKAKENNQSTLVRISKEYDSNEANERNKLEAKLTEIRKKNKQTIKDEESRFKKMVDELKSIHSSKIVELEISQDKEVQKQQEEHNDHLETARQKYKAEIGKLEA